MTNTKMILTGFVAGAVVGTGLGLLLAPDKGAKTRALLADKAKELGDAVGKNYDKAKEVLNLKKGEDKAVFT